MFLDKFIHDTFKDLKFTIYHITSIVFIISIVFIYILFYSIEPEFILDKNKYYLKHTDFNYSKDDGVEFKNKAKNLLIINKDGKLRIFLFSFLFAVAVTFITHILSITFNF